MNEHSSKRDRRAKTVISGMGPFNTVLPMAIICLGILAGSMHLAHSYSYHSLSMFEVAEKLATRPTFDGTVSVWEKVGPEDDDVVQRSGGKLYTDYLVLSSAHKIDTTGEFLVGIGREYWAMKPYFIPVKKIIPHPTSRDLLFYVLSEPIPSVSPTISRREIKEGDTLTSAGNGPSSVAGDTFYRWDSVLRASVNHVNVIDPDYSSLIGFKPFRAAWLNFGRRGPAEDFHPLGGTPNHGNSGDAVYYVPPNELDTLNLPLNDDFGANLEIVGIVVDVLGGESIYNASTIVLLLEDVDKKWIRETMALYPSDGDGDGWSDYAEREIFGTDSENPRFFPQISISLDKANASTVLSFRVLDKTDDRHLRFFVESTDTLGPAADWSETFPYSSAPMLDAYRKVKVEIVADKRITFFRIKLVSIRRE